MNSASGVSILFIRRI